MAVDAIGMPDELSSVHGVVVKINPEMEVDQVLLIRERVLHLLAGAKAVKESLDRALVEWITANGPIHNGPWKYYVTTAKRTKVRDQVKTFEAIVEALGGDVEQIAGCLRAQAIKTTAIKSVLDDWENHVEINEVVNVQTNEPKRIVGEIHEAFAGGTQ